MSSLKFICGSAGSGKSTWLFDSVIRKSEKEPDRNFLFIVPEQFTMATQKELVSRYPGNSIMNIDVLSFQRLAFRVFDDLGKNNLQILGETGKNLVIRKVTGKIKEELSYLSGKLKRMGYVSEIKSLLSEFMQYRVTPEILTDYLEKEEEETAFSRKLKDILIIYQGFRDYLEGTYITAEEVLELLIEVAEESLLLRESVIILDGFTGFTPIQNALLKRIFPLVSEIEVAVTTDTRGDILKKPELSDLFYMSEKMVHALLRTAEETGTEVLPPVLLPDGGKARFREAKCLNHLERNLFRADGVPSEEAQGEIRILLLPNPREELSLAVSTIRRLVRENGMRYRDFAIVTGDLATYANYAAEIFHRYDVPGFVDQNQVVLFHPMTEMVRGLLNILSSNWQSESVFHYLRSGLSKITLSEIDALENYVLARGIRGSLWKQRWAVLPEKGSEEDLLRLNQIRKQLVEEIKPLEEAFSAEDRSALTECRALYDFFLSHEIEGQLLKEAEQKENEGQYEKARGYEQIYGILLELLDQIAFLLKEEKLTAEEFSEILDAGLEAADFGLLPPGYDCVVLGDIERSRLPEIKCLFFLGVNDGIIPGTIGSTGILSELEREEFESAGIELAPSPKERAFIQRFYLYMNLTKPSKHLFLTYAKTDAAGNAIRPSYLISEIEKLFPTLSTEEPGLSEYAFETAESARELYLSEMSKVVKGQLSETFLTLYRYYHGKREFAGFAEKMLDAAFFTHQKERISRETAKALYGATLRGSVTRLEKYAECPYAHFAIYGLGLNERSLHEFRAPDLGNVYHSALELYGKMLSEKGLSWAEVEDTEAERVVSEALSEAVLKSSAGEFFADAKGRYDFKRMERILRRSVLVLSRQLKTGLYLPEALEVHFGKADGLSSAEFDLGPGEKMILTGQIDRLDTFKEGDDLYVKVIDYKSGGTSYDLLAVYEGLQLQLPVYLSAAGELMEKKYKGKRVHPGGIFYYHLDDPLISAEEELSDEEIQKEIQRQLRPDGPFCSEDGAVRALDPGLSDPSNTEGSLVIRAKRKKDGSFDAYSKALSEEDFSLLTQYARHKITGLGREIKSGNIEVLPFERKKEDACKWCKFHGICGYDEKVPGYLRRTLTETGDAELFQKMRDEINGNQLDQ